MAEKTTVSLPSETHQELKQVRREMAVQDEIDYTLDESVSELIDTWRENHD